MVRDGWFAGGPRNEPALPAADLFPHLGDARRRFRRCDCARPPKAAQHARKAPEATGARHHKKAKLGKRGDVADAKPTSRKSAPSGDREPAAAPPLSGDLAAVKNAIDLARKAKTNEATAIAKTIGDPAAQKLVEWYMLRHPDSDANFSRFAAFIADNPNWPGMALMRRRAEARLWQERSNATTVRSFTGDRPTSAKGRLALARALLAEGNRDGAGRWAREAWRSDELSERTEAEALETFRDLLDARGPSGADGQAHRRQGSCRRKTRGAAPRQRRAFDREGLCRGQGGCEQGARLCSTPSEPRPGRIWATRCAAFNGCGATIASRMQPA